MIKDYKGEMPNNVTTPEKAKAQKPFYKNWKFWVLTGLMTLFGACSIYGLVLGSQYVKAIERASHIIADAQSGSATSEVLSKKRQNAFSDISSSSLCYVDLGSFSWIKIAGSSSTPPRFICQFPKMKTPSSQSEAGYLLTDVYQNVSWGRILTIGTDDAIGSLNSSGNKYLGIVDTDYDNVADFTSYVSGKYLYYIPAQGYEGDNLYDDAYQEGYDEGHSDGYQEGYQEGFQDGADSMADAQTIKVLLAPDFTGDRIQYTYTLDGAEVGTGYLSNTNQHYQNQVQFSRPAGGQHSAVLNLYSDNDEPIKIAYDTFTGTLGETRYLWYMKSNAYDWSTNQWYVPTYWAEARFLVTGYGTYDQGFTEDYFFNLDPQNNDRAKVGAYSEGYDAGYNDAVESGDAYDAGYEQGHEDGKSEGETEGFNRGVAVGSSGSQSLAMMFKTAFQLPFDQLYRFLNFNLLGINFLALFTALISVSIGIMVIKKVL